MKDLKFNRNVLKIIAAIFMLIDHIAIVIGKEKFALINAEWLYFILRIIGRIAFPLFSFFVAEGYYYTKNKTKYVLTICLFAIISQPIFIFTLKSNIASLNILFTFLISILLMFLYDRYFRGNIGLFKLIFIFLTFLIIILVGILESINITVDYGILGILMTFFFYVFKHNKVKQIFSFCLLTIVFTILPIIILKNYNIFEMYIQLFSFLFIPFILLYNNVKGKINLKYFFYIFYPAHLLIIYFIVNCLILF